MARRALAIVTVALGFTAALASIVLEATGLFGIDAGSSWTLVVLVSWTIAMGYGLAYRNLDGRKQMFKDAAIAAAIILGVDVAVLVSVFSIQWMGISLHWNPPASHGPFLDFPGLLVHWLFCCMMILTFIGIRKLVGLIWRGMIALFLRQGSNLHA